MYSYLSLFAEESTKTQKPEIKRLSLPKHTAASTVDAAKLEAVSKSHNRKPMLQSELQALEYFLPASGFILKLAWWQHGIEPRHQIQLNPIQQPVL